MTASSICALCKGRSANKGNTHYLTDAIIRSCLNLDGSSEREKGLYFDLSQVSHVEVGFQRETNTERLEKELGRPPTDEEIERAKKNPYSVDGVFCNLCEDIFTKIEDEFTKIVLPRLRYSNLSGKESVSFTETDILRMFFYIQLWRTSICVPQFSVRPVVMEELRIAILHWNETSVIPKFPLSITYLETLGGEIEYTRNLVAILKFKNPYVIIMNDFIVQFYEGEEFVKFESIAGLNDASEYKRFINNFKEKEFAVRIFSDTLRKSFFRAFQLAETRPKIMHYAKSFENRWHQLFGAVPSKTIIEGYLNELTKDGEVNILNYTKENIEEITMKYIEVHGL